MSQLAVRVENVSKKYNLLHNQSKNDSIVGAFAGGLKSVFRFSNQSQTNEEFWALKNVSFDIIKGDRIGIIGRNGAGKSTLLKILSRIVKPTSGKIEYEGKMASLLEVGTGFHGDLTGRENIYLNGSILGMAKHDINRKFDEIVDFAEVERFLDTPVKRYSSGMYVRLAFAVAANLDPDILIVDEVLAVGDAAFQKKCLGKMNEVSTQEGRTILFVSHQMAVLSALCNKSVLLEKGEFVGMGTTESIINKYLQRGEKSTGQNYDDSAPSKGAKLKIRSVRVLNHVRATVCEINNAYEGFIEVSFEVLEKSRGYDVSIELKHLQYGSIFTTCLKDNDTEGSDNKVWQKGLYTYCIKLPLDFLREGEYVCSVAAAIPKVEVLDVFNYDTLFSILDSTSPVAKTTEGRSGAILPVLEWVNTDSVVI
jgi:lipopolysaccharide transport system ATP-binding protein